MKNLSLLFAGIVTACSEKEEQTLQGEPEWQDTADCGEWGDCYGECINPYEGEYDWQISQEVYSTYLDESGNLTEEQCLAICDMKQQTDYIGKVLEILECTDKGQHETGNQIIYCKYWQLPYCEGRMHEGIERLKQTQGLSPAAAWLARAAHAEATSVASFLFLRNELQAFGAPPELLEACEKASREEAMHARLMGRICRDFKAPVPNLVYQKTSRRTLMEIAIENAIEGCVHESYAALQAHYQSKHAPTSLLRKSFSIIARDETSHAELARKIDAWLMSRLDHHQQLEVQKAKTLAYQRLLASHEESDVADGLGLPTSEIAQKMTLLLMQSS